MPDVSTFVPSDVVVQDLIEIAVSNGALAEYCQDHIQAPDEQRIAEYAIEQAIELYGDVSDAARCLAVSTLWSRGLDAQEKWAHASIAESEGLWSGAAAHEAREELG